MIESTVLSPLGAMPMARTADVAGDASTHMPTHAPISNATNNAATKTLRETIAKAEQLLAEQALHSDYKQGMALQRAGRNDEATLKLLKAALTHPAALTAIGNGMAVQGQHKQALMYYMAAAQTQPDQAQVMLNACKSLLQLGHTAEAQEGLTLLQREDHSYKPGMRKEIENLLLQARQDSGDATLKPVFAAPPSASEDAAVVRNMITAWLNGSGFDPDTAIYELGVLQNKTLDKLMQEQQNALDFNKIKRDETVKKKLEVMQEQIDAKAAREAAAAKASFWSKVGSILGPLLAVASIGLAAVTGGASLLVTAVALSYLAVDVGLQIGEKASGIRMSIQSGLQMGASEFLKAVFPNMPEEQRELIAEVIAMAINLIIGVAMGVGLLKGGGVGRLSNAISALKWNAATVAKVSHGVSYAASAAGAVPSIAGGVAGYQMAVEGNKLGFADIARAEAERTQIKISAALQQISTDAKALVEAWNLQLEQVVNMILSSLENRSQTMNTNRKQA